MSIYTSETKGHLNLKLHTNDIIWLNLARWFFVTNKPICATILRIQNRFTMHVLQSQFFALNLIEEGKQFYKPRLFCSFLFNKYEYLSKKRKYVHIRPQRAKWVNKHRLWSIKQKITQNNFFIKKWRKMCQINMSSQ